MIAKEELKKLADLARIEIKEDELENLHKEMGTILDFVGQVQKIAGESIAEVEIGAVKNVMREDQNPNESGRFSKEIIAEFPNKEGDLLKVKKIL